MAQLAYITLLLMGVAAVAAAAVTVNGYIRAVQSARQIDLQIRTLTFEDDENPRVNLRFRLSNHSQVPMHIENFVLHLDLNGERVGNSNSTYRGTDPDVAPDFYSKAAAVEKSLAPATHLDLDFTLYIYAAQQETIRQAQVSGPLTWTARTTFQVLLPNAREQSRIDLTAIYEE